jgi:rhamnulose-1-phosphate aldolase/alcohol dehydrogenase
MKSRWSDAEAQEHVLRYRSAGEDLALRVYTSRLIGEEPDLVLHGGGNTSVKSRARDPFGEEVEVLHVKGSGLDLASIEPEGLPGLRLADLLRLRALESPDDDTLVGEMGSALLATARAPSPSLETLLHAFLPLRFVDHSHADAILVLTNQPDGEARIRALYGERVGWVPYVRPGHALAKRAVETWEGSPAIEALVLEKHGLVTFGDDARTSYERHVALVEEAERSILAQVEGRRPLDARPVVAARSAGEIAPVVRGALAEPTRDPDRPWKRWILEHRSSDDILHLAASDLAPMLCAASPITPDHVIRTKGPYLIVPRPPYADDAALADSLRAEVETYRRAYRSYYERNVERTQREPAPLDATPRIVVLPGVGIFAAGETRRDARIAADIAEHTVRTRIRASMIGRYEGIGEGDLFDMEYWSLERDKLGTRAPAALAGQVALVTGGAGAVAEGIARRLLEAGAHVALADIDNDRLDAVLGRLDGERCEALECDVTQEGDVHYAFEEVAARFGGVDLVVANAGIAEAGSLEELPEEALQRALEVNAVGTFHTLAEALRQLRRQGTGGNVVVVSTKNVFAPGRGFGAYSASKAAAHQLGRIAALEGAEIGVRVNMINADAVFGEASNPSRLWQAVGPERARARGIDPGDLESFYRDRNLLHARVTAEHVGNAVVFFASQATPTTGAALPVDGGLPEAFPR